MHNWLKLLISNILFLLVGLILGFVIFNISESTPKISDSLILRDSIYQTDIKKDSLFRDSLNNANDSIANGDEITVGNSEPYIYPENEEYAYKNGSLNVFANDFTPAYIMRVVYNGMTTPGL